MTNPQDISKKLIQIRHEANDLQGRLMEIDRGGLNDADQAALLVSLAKTYRDIIDMLKKNGSLVFDELKQTGMQSLEGEAGSVTLHSLDSSASVKVSVSKDSDGQVKPPRLEFL